MSHKPITTTLAMLHGGVFIETASEEFAQLVKMVDQTGKPGQLTIQIKLKKSSGAMQVDATVTAKIPEPKADSTLLWPTVDGNLVLDNPAQRKLDLQQVPNDKGPLRSAS